MASFPHIMINGLPRYQRPSSIDAGKVDVRVHPLPGAGFVVTVWVPGDSAPVPTSYRATAEEANNEAALAACLIPGAHVDLVEVPE